MSLKTIREGLAGLIRSEALQTYPMKCSCGHIEPRLMQQATAEMIKHKRGGLISTTPCDKCQAKGSPKDRPVNWGK
jgi:hypothetical protein